MGSSLYFQIPSFVFGLQQEGLVWSCQQKTTLRQSHSRKKATAEGIPSWKDTGLSDPVPKTKTKTYTSGDPKFLLSLCFFYFNLWNNQSKTNLSIGFCFIEATLRD